MKFKSDGSTNDWGYKLTICGIFAAWRGTFESPSLLSSRVQPPWPVPYRAVRRVCTPIHRCRRQELRCPHPSCHFFAGSLLRTLAPLSDLFAFNFEFEILNYFLFVQVYASFRVKVSSVFLVGVLSIGVARCGRPGAIFCNVYARYNSKTIARRRATTRSPSSKPRRTVAEASGIFPRLMSRWNASAVLRLNMF